MPEGEQAADREIGLIRGGRLAYRFGAIAVASEWLNDVAMSGRSRAGVGPNPPDERGRDPGRVDI
jgi:hypothetical protein